MLGWFGQKAPIRTKFRTLTALYALVGLAMVGATAALSTGAAGGTVAIGAAVAGLVLIVGINMLAARLICTPYVDTVVRMEGLARGDLTGAIRYTDHADCVGRMTKAMAVFRDNAVAAAKCDEQQAMAIVMAEGLARLAKGDLTHRITADLTGPFAPLKDDFNQAVVALNTALNAVANASADIHKGAGEIRSASDDLSLRTEQQAASLEQTAVAMDEVTGTVRQTADDARRASAAVEQARADTGQGGAVVGRAMEAMGHIERSSNEISEIIGVIDGIAFQTNLLALNAGVEAARAGDAGRGFAVVASEVRALAQRSADAAKDVKTRITRSSEQVVSGVALVGETGQALERITGRIAEIETLVAGIAAAAGHQATGLAEVNNAVAQMDGVTQQNAAMVEQATAAARGLSQQADSLAEEIGRFDTGNAARMAPAAPVHDLQARAAAAFRPAPARRGGGNLAVAIRDDDWSAF